jgi:hypothetical protein
MGASLCFFRLRHEGLAPMGRSYGDDDPSRQSVESLYFFSGSAAIVVRQSTRMLRLPSRQ